MTPLIITAALVGAELTRNQTPYLPLTLDEIAEEARRCVTVGASVIHLHVRDAKGQPTNDVKVFKSVISKIRKACNPVPIIQVSTGGQVGDSFESRMGPLQAKPDMASLNAGSVNFGNEVFSNPRPFIEKLAKEILKRKIKPEIEIYDLSHLETACELIDQGLISQLAHFQFVMGVSLQATEENLQLLVSRLPKKSTWTVAGISRHEFPMAALAITMGGHVRVGLEDNIYVEKGLLAKGSYELVEKAASLSKKHHRPIASVQEAQNHLKVREIIQ